jgi:hypothetical protein
MTRPEYFYESISYDPKEDIDIRLKECNLDGCRIHSMHWISSSEHWLGGYFIVIVEIVKY